MAYVHKGTKSFCIPARVYEIPADRAWVACSHGTTRPLPCTAHAQPTAHSPQSTAHSPQSTAHRAQPTAHRAQRHSCTALRTSKRASQRGVLVRLNMNSVLVSHRAAPLAASRALSVMPRTTSYPHIAIMHSTYSPFCSLTWCDPPWPFRAFNKSTSRWYIACNSQHAANHTTMLLSARELQGRAHQAGMSLRLCNSTLHHGVTAYKNGSKMGR